MNVKIWKFDFFPINSRVVIKTNQISFLFFLSREEEEPQKLNHTFKRLIIASEINGGAEFLAGFLQRQTISHLKTIALDWFGGNLESENKLLIQMRKWQWFLDSLEHT